MRNLIKDLKRNPILVIQISTTSDKMHRHNSNKGTLSVDFRDIAIFSTPEHPKMGYTTSEVKSIVEDNENIVVKTRNSTYVYKRLGA